MSDVRVEFRGTPAELRKLLDSTLRKLPAILTQDVYVPPDIIEAVERAMGDEVKSRRPATESEWEDTLASATGEAITEILVAVIRTGWRP